MIPLNRKRRPPIPGAPIFDGAEAMKGLDLNRMCFSLNSAKNRSAFLADPEGYCGAFGLSAAQREAVQSRDLLRMIAAGGNLYYLSKLAGAFGIGMPDMAAQPAGAPRETFRAEPPQAGL